MQRALKAVIFDMDGVLIDSEPLWRRAMMKGFGEVGMPLSDEDCRKTMGLRFIEVIHYWVAHYKASHVNSLELEKQVMDILLELIETEGKLIAGIAEIIDFCKEKNIKMGLATSSSNQLMHAVLKKLGIANALTAAVSAEHLQYGKPHPQVFLSCAAFLKTEPKECVVIEDSLNGVIAGKAAQMQVVAVPEDKFQKIDKFIVADYTCENMYAVLGLFKSLFAPA
jgi:sugar-phosphatase